MRKLKLEGANEATQLASEASSVASTLPGHRYQLRENLYSIPQILDSQILV
jgi:hypothetical protein